MLSIIFLATFCEASDRIWTAINGNEIEAEFISKDKDIIKLKLKSGKFYEVPANKLSQRDNLYVDHVTLLDSLTKIKSVYNSGDEKKFESREGLIYLKGSDTPFTGELIEDYEPFQKTEAGYRSIIDGFYFLGDVDELNYFEFEGETKIRFKRRTLIYKDGKKVGAVRWSVTGFKFSSETYNEKGEIHGLRLVWGPTGFRKREQNYKNGKPHGSWVSWHLNGKKDLEHIYENGDLADGIQKNFWRNGNLATVTFYRDNKKQWRKHYHINGKIASLWKVSDDRIVEGSEKYWNRGGRLVRTWDEAGWGDGGDGAVGWTREREELNLLFEEAKKREARVRLELLRKEKEERKAFEIESS